MTNAIINPIERPEVTQQLSENVILTTVDDLYNWAKMSSLYPKSCLAQPAASWSLWLPTHLALTWSDMG